VLSEESSLIFLPEVISWLPPHRAFFISLEKGVYLYTGRPKLGFVYISATKSPFPGVF